MNYLNRKNPGIYVLHGLVQHYAWGGRTFIPELLNIKNTDNKPFAEYWIGAHPKSPSKVNINDEIIGLPQLIKKAPRQILGDYVIDKFGHVLPYLFKVLDVRDMLSIQAHPSKQQAVEGFARENKLGIPADAPNRSYRDDNHKLEVQVALTDFRMLHGFRELSEIREILNSVPEFFQLLPEFKNNNLKNLYRFIMTMPQEQVDKIINPLLDRLTPLYNQNILNQDEPDYWAVHTSFEFPLPDGHRDRGIFSIYLLNLLHLKPGQGTFQATGVLHAYLSGITMELMANSDNVVRGGLTSKYIDVPELLNTLSFETGKPDVLHGQKISGTETVYKTPASDFELSRITLDENIEHVSQDLHGPDAMILLEGTVTAECENNKLKCSRGEVILVPANLKYKLKTNNNAVLYKATVPIYN
ncbi:mannose-6-phosphate isomerase, class I [candidate division KSB1 bacterium]|nr:mannose-6-phosphate isomerase, class I [candidate division KSB1 bacterium]